jgi:hypothetical protein
MCGAIPLPPQYAYMAWCSVKSAGTTLLYFTLLQFYNLQKIQRRIYHDARFPCEWNSMKIRQFTPASPNIQTDTIITCTEVAIQRVQGPVQQIPLSPYSLYRIK